MSASYEQVSVAVPAATVLELLRRVVLERELTEYAVVDHGHDMEAAGVASHPAWTLIFGRPAAGEILLARDLATAVDIPLRLAVIGTSAETSAIVLRPMESLLDESLGEIAAGFTDVLRSLAVEARHTAERRS